jgi:hypothetical protein
MRKAFMVLALGGILSGCSPVGISSHSYVTGNPIPEENIKKIQNGKTTVDEVFSMFGTPEQTVDMGDVNLFIYKQCKVKGRSIDVRVVDVGSSSGESRCNTLTLTIDKETKVVKTYNWQKVF